VLTRTLGRTGIRVSVLGLGTVKFGRNTGVNYPKPFELPGDGQLADLLALAKTCGINLLDTAPAYGTSEVRLGEAIEGERDDWLICTKAGEEFDGSRSRYDFSEDHILRSASRSLSRLRTETLDVVLVHTDGRPVGEIRAAGAFRALARLREEGTVRAIGFSGRTVLDATAALGLSDVLMCTINASYREEIPLAGEAGDQGVGVMVKKPLAQGHEADARHLVGIARLRGVSNVVVGTIDPDHLAAAAAALNGLTG